MPSQWVGFWMAIIGVAGTLLGLAFVTYQVRPSWREERPKYLIAVFNLAEFCVPLFTALVCVMPGNPWRVAAAGAGLGGAVLIVLYWSALRGVGELESFDKRQRMWSFCSMALAVALIGASLIGGSPGLWVLGAIQVWLIFSGSVESWLLLDAGRLTNAGASSSPHATGDPNSEAAALHDSGL